MNTWDIDPNLYLSIWRSIFRAIRRLVRHRETHVSSCHA